jgi:hypothetical protein
MNNRSVPGLEMDLSDVALLNQRRECERGVSLLSSIDGTG